MRKTSTPEECRRDFPAESSCKLNPSVNLCHGQGQSPPNWKPRFSVKNFGNIRPVRKTAPPLPNFTIELAAGRRGSQKTDFEALIAKFKPTRENFLVSQSGSIGKLCFSQWVEALGAMVRIWELRLEGTHNFTPNLKSNVIVPSDMDELHDRTRNLFSDHIKRLIEGEEVKKCRLECERISDEIAEVSNLLKKPKSLDLYTELSEKRKTLISERDLIMKRMQEFESGMNCILSHLERKKSVDCDIYGVELFRFDGQFNWNQIHFLIMREFRRFEDGLPIYGHRLEILQQIHSQQIMVLIGETGSGKSTQLVQFLADSGIAASESVICTQPRKIAAISLAQRVREECNGCYGDDSIICFPTFSSAQLFESKVIFMTDHCLLQHYMNDNNMSGISCIIIDEAHERSLNTDLLLALVKGLLCRRLDLQLIIMSATANSKQLSEYFFGCGIFHVLGRTFLVDVKYVPCGIESTTTTSAFAPYVSDVLRMASEIDRTEKEGTILAFLTSQMEVEWACEKFEAPATVSLPLHGKLTSEEQFRVFQKYPGKRKVIFATNLAETSLTIPGVKYVIDSGLVKDRKFEPGSGMNVLKVCQISQSSANQRAGRAGRTEPGRCYRLYSEIDFEKMPPNQEPEIRRVHLGVAMLRILALGIKNIEDFDFVDAPCHEAVDMAIRNLLQLGAVRKNEDFYELTDEGLYLVKLGIEPRLGKLILSCFDHCLGREGIILAAVMANASSIFCRIGSNDDKQKSDCLKVRFCHGDGDLLTLLSVFKEWEALPLEKKSKWCWDNSINAKTMRRCQDTVTELENCLHQELNIIIPTYWRWNHEKFTNQDTKLKKAILASLADNVAMYSGYCQLGYVVALTGQHAQLHPSCSLLMFDRKPGWVVFSELLSVSAKYLVCVTALDFESLSTVSPPLPFSVSDMENHKLQSKVLTGLGSTLLKRICGQGNSNVISLTSHIRKACSDENIGIEVKVDHNEIVLYAPSQRMEHVFSSVNRVVEYERNMLRNECLEKSLYHGAGAFPSTALFGGGAEIRHLELKKRFLTIELFHSNIDDREDKELLMYLEKLVSGSICAIQKFTGSGQGSDNPERGLRITFLTPEAAEKAVGLEQVCFGESVLRVIPSQLAVGGNNKMFSFPAVKARVYWPRRISKGVGIVKCNRYDVNYIVNDLSNQIIGGRCIRSEASTKYIDSLVINGLDTEASEAEILDVIRSSTNRIVLNFFLVRGNPVENPPISACEDSLLKEISRFMPKRSPYVNCCRVQVFPPEPKDTFMKASITFDGRLHLEAAKALEHIGGKVLPGFLSWQKIECQQLFHSSLSCFVPVYFVIKRQLDSLVSRFGRRQGVECTLGRNDNGSYRVKISANATKTVAELRRPLEELMRGKTIDHPNLTPAILLHLMSRDGICFMKKIQQETGTYILFDRHSRTVRIFGSPEKIASATQKLIQSLLNLHGSKHLEIHLRGESLPPDIMKRVVQKFGPDLHGLREKVPGAEFTLNTRRHIIYIHGNKELKPKVEEMINEIAQSEGSVEGVSNEDSCAICLCEVEDGYQLEDCTHVFCRACLEEQFESAIKNRGSFPICCARQNCKSPILLTDLRALLSNEKLEELFRASLGAFVTSSRGSYRFCPSPDCPSIYQVAAPEMAAGEPFVCEVCFSETCTKCHLEYHPSVSCELYREFKDDPESSLNEWRKDKEHVKNCPVCGFTIEKGEGCNHIECRCGRHICWVCLEFFDSSNECYGHLRNIHMTII